MDHERQDRETPAAIQLPPRPLTSIARLVPSDLTSDGASVEAVERYPRLADVKDVTDVAALRPADVERFRASGELTGKVKKRALNDGAEPLLRGPFKSNWFYAKDVLLKNQEFLPEETFKKYQNDVFGPLMDGLLGLREKQYNELLEFIKRDRLGQQVPLDHRLVWSAAGSATRSSDIDVNLKGLYSIQAVTLFNDLFRTKLKYDYEPGTVMDVNVYAKDMMVGKRGDPSSKDAMARILNRDTLQAAAKNADEQALIVPNQEVEIDGEAFMDFAENQDVWSLAHTRRYMNEGEWNSYKEQMTHYGNDRRLLDKMTLAEVRFSQYELNLKRKREDLRDSTDSTTAGWGQLQQLLRRVDSSTTPADGLSADERRERDAADMFVANQVYADKLERVQQLRGLLERLDAEQANRWKRLRKRTPGQGEFSAVGVELKRAISEALMYANEVYVTQGAIHHAVIGTQIGRAMSKGYASLEIDLPRELFMHAFEENVADFLKATAHGTRQPGRGLEHDLEHGGKYLDRMMEAAGKIGIRTSDLPNFSELERIGQVFAENKAKVETDPTVDPAALAASAATTFDRDADLRPLVIALSVRARHRFRATRPLRLRRAQRLTERG